MTQTIDFFPNDNLMKKVTQSSNKNQDSLLTNNISLENQLPLDIPTRTSSVEDDVRKKHIYILIFFTIISVIIRNSVCFVYLYKIFF